MKILSSTKKYIYVSYRLHHLHIAEVVDNVLKNVSVGHKPQRPKHNHDRNLLFDVRQSHNDPATNGTLTHTRPPSTRQLANPEAANRSRRVLDVRPNLSRVSVLGLLLGENIHGICCHLFLSNEHLFGAVYDEIATGIQRTFVQFGKITISQSVQETVCGPEHNGYFSNEGFRVLLFLRVIVFLSLNSFGNVNIERG